MSKLNIFQLDYFSRLQAWSKLREQLQNQPLNKICIEVDNFWQQCPQSTHYLHPSEINKWPDPWQLLDDNVYCPYSRAYGMIVTLFILGIQDVELVDAKDYNDIDVVLVIVNKNYILNYWPNTVVNNKPEQFTITKQYDISSLKKIGNL